MKRSLAIIIGVFLVLGGLNRFVFKDFIPQASYAVLRRPLVYAQNKLLPVGAYLRALPNLSGILVENQRLHDENATLLAKLTDRERLERENKLLREQLGVQARRPADLRLAKIFAITKTPLAATLLIDQGQAEGVAVGMAVVAAGNVLVGSVATVYEHSALVWQLTDGHTQISVQVGAVGQNVIGRARGNGTEELALELVTNQETIQPEELVTTSGLDRLPAGLLVGKVSSVALQGGNLFQSVKLRPFFSQPDRPDIFVIIK